MALLQFTKRPLRMSNHKSAALVFGEAEREMAKFSVGRENGEGPSNPRPVKQARISREDLDVDIEGEAETADTEDGAGEEDEDRTDESMQTEDEESESESESESEEQVEDQQERNHQVPRPNFWEFNRTDVSNRLSRLTNRRDTVVRERALGDSRVDSIVSERTSRSGPIFLTLTDPEVLDCPICYEPLTIPVFQCENGHTTCSSCCKKVAHKCPSCSLPTGYNRCRAIEKVIESVKISCQNRKYGCKESIFYSKKFDHDKTCIYSPCSCPLSTCNFINSSKQLYQHFSSQHGGSVLRFEYNKTFPVFFTPSEKFLVLQEEKEGVLFILRNGVELLGNLITVSCIGPPSSKEGNLYDLTAKMEGSSLRFQSLTKNVQRRIDQPSSLGCFLLVPCDFLGSFGQITLDLCIWRCGERPANFLTSTSAA